jgi:hypothetical protein
MGWTNTEQTELVAPTGTPFAPGNDVIGFGTQLPPELAAYGVTAAIVIYNDQWDASLTTPCIKFSWIGMSDTYLCLGLAITANPSANPVAVISSGLNVGMFTDGTGELNCALNNSQDNVIWEVQENIGSGNGEETGYANNGTTLWDLPGDAGT